MIRQHGVHHARLRYAIVIAKIGDSYFKLQQQFLLVDEQLNEARFPSMPRSALEYIEADYKVQSAEIAPLLVQLAQLTPEQPAQEEMVGNGMDDDIKRM